MGKTRRERKSNGQREHTEDPAIIQPDWENVGIRINNWNAPKYILGLRPGYIPIFSGSFTNMLGPNSWKTFATKRTIRRKKLWSG